MLPREGSAPRLPAADSRFEPLKLCGGRGTERPAAEGEFIAVERSLLFDIGRPASGLTLLPSLRAAEVSPRAAEVSPRAAEVSPLRAFMAPVLAELAGGVMRLAAGRELTLEAGWAAPRVEFAPKVAARPLGLASRWLVGGVFLSWFIWLDESFISLPWIAPPCSSVLWEIAVKPRLKFAK